MKYKILLREIATGQEKLIWMTSEWDDDSTRWWLTEGNFGCDCNRSILWDRANSIETDDEDWCGDMEAFTIPWAELADGTRVGIDAEV